jgi:hypothetical protein
VFPLAAVLRSCPLLRLLVSVRWCPAVALKPHCRHGGLFWMSARAAGCNGATSLHMFCTCSSAVSIRFSKMCRACKTKHVSPCTAHGARRTAHTSGAIDLLRGGAVRLRPAGRLGIRPLSRLSRLSRHVRPQTSQAVMIGRGQRWTKRGHGYGMWQDFLKSFPHLPYAGLSQGGKEMGWFSGQGFECFESHSACLRTEARRVMHFANSLMPITPKGMDIPIKCVFNVTHTHISCISRYKHIKICSKNIQYT